MLIVWIELLLPLKTGIASSFPRHCKATNYLSLIQSTKLVMSTRMTKAISRQTPLSHPSLGSAIMPVIMLRIEQIASTNRILSFIASLSDSRKGGSCALGLVF